MMTAGEWSRQHEQASRDYYNINVAPKKAARRPARAGMTANDRKNALLLILAVGLICIGMVISSAFVASVNYSNNRIKAENEALRSEVDVLKTELDSATNINTIAAKASDKLGMVFPDGKKYVELTSAQTAGSHFAASLKKQAFD